ncbi:MAG: hypothetical protein ACO2ZZ_10690 [Cyclobacteriaceae bacterium]
MKKERSISTKYIQLYQVLAIAAVSAFVIFYGTSFIRDRGWFGILMWVLYVAFVIYFWYPSFLKNIREIKQISYDDEYLYVHEQGADTQIPLALVRDVEIARLDGMYRYNLMEKEPFGAYILCKTSIWYPLNFRKVDQELNRVRNLISRRKRTFVEENQNSLPSNTA